MAKPLTNVGSRPAAYGPAEYTITFTLALIWGSAFLWIALGVDHLAPGVVALGRLVLGAAALAIIPRARRRIARSDWARIVLIAAVGNAAPALLFAVAETQLSSAVAGMITGGTPVLALVVSSVMLGRLPGRAQAIGIAVGFVGIVLMTLPSLRGADAAPLGVALVLIATLGYAINSNLLVPLQQEYGGLAVTLWGLVVASVMMTPFAVAGIGSSEFAPSAVVAVLILGVIGTGFARALATTLAGRVGGPRMTTTTYLIPIVAVILGVVFRNETVTPMALMGVALVLAGAYGATRAVGTHERVSGRLAATDSE